MCQAQKFGKLRARNDFLKIDRKINCLFPGGVNTWDMVALSAGTVEYTDCLSAVG